MKGERSTNEKHVFRLYFPTASYLLGIKDSQIGPNDLHNLLGYDFDALVVDVDELDGRLPRTPFEKLEQFLYDGDDRDILARYSRGSLVEKPFTE